MPSRASTSKASDLRGDGRRSRTHGPQTQLLTREGAAGSPPDLPPGDQPPGGQIRTELRWVRRVY